VDFALTYHDIMIVPLVMYATVCYALIYPIDSITLQAMQERFSLFVVDCL
jgi:hypothetical protein